MFIKLWNDKNKQWFFTDERHAKFLVKNNPSTYYTLRVKKLNDEFQALKNHPDPLHGSKRYKNGA